MYYSKNQVLYKIENNEKFQFQNLQLGDIEQVDILNPLKILVFYKEANTVLILDNRLNEIDRLNFNTIREFKTVDFAGLSKHTWLWIFNVDSQQLELFDYKANTTINRSIPIFKEIQGFKSNYNFCWIQHPNAISLFNINGSKLNEFDLEGLISFNTFKNQVMLLTTSHLKWIDREFNTIQTFKKPKINFNRFYFNDQNLYIYSDKVLNIYRLTTVNN
jgi:hypothetical protein